MAYDGWNDKQFSLQTHGHKAKAPTERGKRQTPKNQEIM